MVSFEKYFCKYGVPSNDESIKLNQSNGSNLFLSSIDGQSKIGVANTNNEFEVGITIDDKNMNINGGIYEYEWDYQHGSYLIDNKRDINISTCGSITIYADRGYDEHDFKRLYFKKDGNNSNYDMYKKWIIPNCKQLFRFGPFKIIDNNGHYYNENIYTKGNTLADRNIGYSFQYLLCIFYTSIGSHRYSGSAFLPLNFGYNWDGLTSYFSFVMGGAVLSFRWHQQANDPDYGDEEPDNLSLTINGKFFDTNVDYIGENCYLELYGFDL